MAKANPKDFERDLFTFFQMTPDWVCIAGKDGFFRKVNRAVISKLEYTEEELFARPIVSFIHPEDKEQTSQRRASLLKGEALLNFQNRYLTKSGKTIWLEWSSIYLPDKEVVFAVAKDITLRKQVEKEVEEEYKKFKSLAIHFKTSMEEDRKYFATGLHEDLAQLVSSVKTDIDWINNNIPEMPASSRNRIEHAMAVSDLLINTIRRMSFAISPHMLDELGLNAALEWHCREFSMLNGIQCRFEGLDDESALSREIKIDFFRICQEALQNVVQHAAAANVVVRMSEERGKICLRITDDGHGFDTNQQKPSPGLLAMRRRAASVGGQLTVRSDRGKGTCVCVEVGK